MKKHHCGNASIKIVIIHYRSVVHHDFEIRKNITCDVEDYIRKSGGIIIAAKKCTNYAIGVTTATLCEALNYDTDSVLTISSMMNGEYGIDDVCLSIPSVVGAKGLTGHIVAPLTDAEVASLRHSTAGRAETRRHMRTAPGMAR